ncbi:hypothetical protein [Leptospira yasudae]|uniref:hypothetical protein n=1 Tax=Leptospira yasudae TaxID=2202201 RepID=UPI001FC90598|nr:hypothetical protein [Leptospira yasudae]
MKKNIMKFAAVIALTVAFAACKKDDKDDNTTTAALLYMLDQTSGNCATTLKLSATQYFTTLSVIPKGGCNLATIVGSTLANYIVLQSANADAAIAAATALGSCTNTINAITTQKNGIAATSQTAYDTAVANYRFTPISDLRIEGAIAIPTTYNSLGVTSSDVLTWNRATVDQYKTATTLSTIAQLAIAAVEPACGTAVSNKLKTDFKGFAGLDSSITSKSQITSIHGANCFYGSGVAANTLCATLNTQY